MSAVPEDAPIDRNEMAPRRHAGYWVIAGILSMATLMGTYAYSRFDASERHLMAQLDEFTALGAQGNETTCVDAVLAWLPTCPAMLSLCQDLSLIHI